MSEPERPVVAENDELALLVDAVQDYAIFLMSPDGEIRSWNRGAARIFGYPESEVLGQHFCRFYGPTDLEERKPQRELEVAARDGRIEDEGWRLRKEGTRFWANTIITVLRNDDGGVRGFAKVTRDMSERKEAQETQRALLEQREARLQAEEERRRAEASYRVAQEANRAKDEFLMTLSHELRTPMTAILGWARMLPSMSPSDPMFHEAVASIAHGAQLQARLIDDILDVSRIVAGKLRLAPEVVELARVIMNAVDAINASADAKEIALSTSLASGLGTVIADATRLQQMIWNLLSNAVKFTPKGGRVQVSARRTASHVQIAVTDSGEGIDPSFLPHVFEPFRQAESPRTRVHGGLGLGLSIVRYLAEAHGGSVTAESSGRGAGATFTLTLPVRAVSTGSAPIENLSPERMPKMGRLRGLEIVLVDDEPESRKMVAAVLRSAGANVLPLESAMAALDVIDQHRPTAVITDIAMPEMDGYTFARRLRERPYGAALKIVALSAFPARAEDPSDFDAWLAKPIDPFRLIEEIARVSEQVGA